MGFFSKLWKGPEVDLEKSGENAKKMRDKLHRLGVKSLSMLTGD